MSGGGDAGPPPGEGRAGGVASWARERSEQARHAAEEARAWAERERGRSRLVALGFDLAERDTARLGGLLAGALAYRFFLWLLPFTLLVVGVLGAVTSIDDGAPADISTNIGLQGFIGDIVRDGAHQRGWFIAIAIGLFGTVYAGLGVVRALRVSHAAAWGMRPERGARTLRASLILAAVVIGLGAAVGLAGWLRHVTAIGGVLALMAGGLVYFTVWSAISWTLPNRAASLRELLPGAVLVAVGAQGLHVFTVYYLAGRAQRAASLYGTIGAALTLLLWLFIIARLMVAGAILNAELARRRSEAEEAV